MQYIDLELTNVLSAGDRDLARAPPLTDGCRSISANEQLAVHAKLGARYAENVGRMWGECGTPAPALRTTCLSCTA